MLCQLLQFIITHCIFECAVLMDLQDAGKSQGKIAGVRQLVEVSSHYLYYKWILEEVGLPGYL